MSTTFIHDNLIPYNIGSRSGSAGNKIHPIFGKNNLQVVLFRTAESTNATSISPTGGKDDIILILIPLFSFINKGQPGKLKWQEDGLCMYENHNLAIARSSSSSADPLHNGAIGP